MTKLYLTRHGETEWNLQKKMQGWHNSPLTQLGEKQAKWLGDRLAEVELETIYTSTSGRTQRTAELIRGNRNIDLIPKDNLREINLGDWEGEFVENIKKQENEAFRKFWEEPHNYRKETGETFYQLKDRVVPLIKQIISDHNPNSNILVVTHAAVLKVLMAHFENRPIEKLWDPPFMYQTCLNLVEINENGYKVLLHGDTSHYQE
ncbi:histidine phosphatase family protein [Natranaerobius thermophilus]|uniref:Phosphoglycerate mutase n=1 Tax=Natranaerobius thermophilus (strain ATCC BAA-1301 / DSM 18059 / JW/NM-WN-LF) TaxID=457570 RepID=B2A0N3_NATTJ|nr:histidine phosphatase family protein [Natranaerobius thermophilus]ACB84591.1 Phosphoglycerate mutase [Natranaerobius thermophilus JW/NM-WN-LF]